MWPHQVGLGLFGLEREAGRGRWACLLVAHAAAEAGPGALATVNMAGTSGVLCTTRSRAAAARLLAGGDGREAETADLDGGGRM